MNPLRAVQARRRACLVGAARWASSAAEAPGSPSKAAPKPGSDGGGAGAGGGETNAVVSEVQEATDLVFQEAVNQRYVVLRAEDYERGSELVENDPRWENSGGAMAQHAASDNMWKDWEQLEREKTAHEILDLPEFASAATMYLRWRVCELRCRPDKFLNISHLMEGHLLKRRTAYRNAHRTMRHAATQMRGPKARRGVLRDLFSIPSREQLAQIRFAPYTEYVHARHKRDMLTMFTEDSFTRTARRRAIAMNLEMGRVPWKQDAFYVTKWEGRIMGVKNIFKLFYHSVKLPVVFLAWRTVLMAAEHLSLGVDYGRAYARGGRSVRAEFQTQHRVATHRPDGKDHTDGQQMLRAKINASKSSSPLTTIIVIVGAIALGVHLWTHIYEGRLPSFMVPAHEREQYDTLYDQSFGASAEKRNRGLAPVVPKEPKPNFEGMSNW